MTTYVVPLATRRAAWHALASGGAPAPAVPVRHDVDPNRSTRVDPSKAREGRPCVARGRAGGRAPLSFLDRTARALLRATNAAVAGVARLASRRLDGPPRSILVHRVGRLGDGAAAWPALRALRRAHPTARLVLLTSTGEDDSPGLAELAGTLVDEVRRYRPSEVRSLGSARELARELARERFDAWQALPQVGTRPWTELRNVAFARAAGARRLRGFGVGGLRWLARGLDRRLAPAEPEATRLLRLVDAVPDDTPLLVPAEARDRLRASLGACPGPPPLALAPGAARDANRWPLERFLEVGRAELARGGRIVLVGGAAERPLTAELVARLGANRCTDLTGALDVHGTLAALERARGLVANDTGVAHLGGLLGLPTVVVQSARDVAGRWRPWGPHVRVLREEVPCGPCWEERCPLDHRCLVAHDAARVLAALEELVAEARPPASGGSSGSEVDKRASLGSPIRPAP